MTDVTVKKAIVNEDVPGVGGPSWISTVLVLIPAAIGVAAAAACLSTGENALTSAMTKSAAGYRDIFAHTYTVKEAFLRATEICRADIAVFFLTLLFPYTAASRPLTVSVSFLRAWLTAIAVAFSLASPLSVISLSVSLPPSYLMLRHADVMYGRIKRRVAMRPRFSDLLESVISAAVCSGAVIFLRTVILLAAGIFNQ